jgi:hypothetical protein
METRGEANIVNMRDNLLHAPTFRKIEEGADDEEEGDGEEEEDISDEAVLARHTEVLARMREKIEIIRNARGRGRGGGNLSFGVPMATVASVSTKATKQQPPPPPPGAGGAK